MVFWTCAGPLSLFRLCPPRPPPFPAVRSATARDPCSYTAPTHVGSTGTQLPRGSHEGRGAPPRVPSTSWVLLKAQTDGPPTSRLWLRGRAWPRGGGGCVSGPGKRGSRRRVGGEACSLPVPRAGSGASPHGPQRLPRRTGPGCSPLSPAAPSTLRWLCSLPCTVSPCPPLGDLPQKPLAPESLSQ